MTEPSISLNSFLVRSSAPRHPQLLISLSPGAPNKRHLGRLFALTEIPADKDELKTNAQIFINKFFKQFQELATENAETAFERALEWANQNAKELLRLRPKTSLNLLLGCLKKDHIQFAVAGRLSAHIIYKERGGLQHLNLIQNYAHPQTGLPAEEAGETAFFSDLVSGVLHPENFIFFATSSVFDFLTINRLKKIIASQPPQEVCLYLEKILNEMGRPVSSVGKQAGFGGILVECGPACRPPAGEAGRGRHLSPKVAVSGAERVGSNASIRKLISKEEETARILSPSFWPDLKKLFTFDRPRLAVSHQQSAISSQQTEMLKKIAHVYNVINSWRARLVDNASLIGRKAAAAPQKIKPPNLDVLSSAAQILLRQIWRLLTTMYLISRPLVLRLKFRFLALPPKRRVLFAVSCALLLFFLISLGSVTFWEKHQLANERYNQTVNEIKTKLDEAEATIIYKDEDAARELLKQIRSSLASFPRNSKNRQQMFERLSGATTNLAAKLQRFITVTAKLEVDASGVQPQPTDFILFNKNILFLTRGSNIANVYESGIKKFTAAPLVAGGFKNKTPKDETVLLLSANNKLVRFDPAIGLAETKNAVWLSPDADIKLIAIYNNRLYAADVKNNTISRHQASTTGFGKGETWLKNSGLNLSSAAEWAFDGNIYLAKENGEIWKLESGKKQNFDLSEIDPPIAAAPRLFTQKGSNRLFILDTERKRVILWNKKENKIINQLVSPDFSAPRDFTVVEKEKKIYILNGAKLISVKYQ